MVIIAMEDDQTPSSAPGESADFSTAELKMPRESSAPLVNSRKRDRTTLRMALEVSANGGAIEGRLSDKVGMFGCKGNFDGFTLRASGWAREAIAYIAKWECLFRNGYPCHA